LQFHFNEVVFSEEMKMYEEEGVPADHITFVDNSRCVELIEHRLVGLLSLLDEECSLGKATDQTYANKIDQAFNTSRPNENPYYVKNKTRPEAFTVRHFAGNVEYVVTNFLDKNRDAISTTLQEVAASSSVSLVSDLFTPGAEDVSSNRRSSKAAGAKSTLGGQFRNQLIGLVGMLQQTEPHFVRCVKPNHQKKPNLFDGNLALRQLRYAGLFEAIRIRQSGYAYRVTHGTFVRHFITLVDGMYVKIITNQVTHGEAATSILEDCTSQGLIRSGVWHVGKSKVFIKTNEDRVHLERHRIKRVEGKAVRIQAFIRGCLVRCRVWKNKYEKIKRQKAMEAATQRRAVSAVIIQKVLRGYLCRRTRAVLNELVTLRVELSNRNADKAEVLFTVELF
jgi:myosin heavy subunit